MYENYHNHRAGNTQEINEGQIGAECQAGQASHMGRILFKGFRGIGMSEWTDEEIKRFKEVYSNKTRDELLKLFPNRTAHAMRGKAQKLRLRKTKETYSRTVAQNARKAFRTWSEREEELLKQNYPHRPTKELLNLLPNRTLYGIIGHAQKLKLKKVYSHEFIQHIKLQLTEKEKIWISAAIDFEGTIGITKKKDKRKLYPYVEMSNTDKRLVDYFSGLTSFYVYKRKSQAPRKSIYMAKSRNLKQIYGFLESLEPYLIAKRRNALLVMEFIRIHNNVARKYGIGNKIHLTKRQIEIHEELKQLNMRGMREYPARMTEVLHAGD